MGGGWWAGDAHGAQPTFVDQELLQSIYIAATGAPHVLTQCPFHCSVDLGQPETRTQHKSDLTSDLAVS